MSSFEKIIGSKFGTLKGNNYFWIYLNDKEMGFNSNFYQPNTSATLEQAKEVLERKGIKGATFKCVSRSNGASFYFDFNGTEIRVSDHRKTGYYDGIQFDLYQIKTIGINKK